MIFVKPLVILYLCFLQILAFVLPGRNTTSRNWKTVNSNNFIPYHCTFTQNFVLVFSNLIGIWLGIGLQKPYTASILCKVTESRTCTDSKLMTLIRSQCKQVFKPIVLCLEFYYYQSYRHWVRVKNESRICLFFNRLFM